MPVRLLTLGEVLELYVRIMAQTGGAVGLRDLGALESAVARPHLAAGTWVPKEAPMIRKLPSGEFRLYSRNKDPKTGRRRSFGTFPTREAAEAHERAVQYFKRRG